MNDAGPDADTDPDAGPDQPPPGTSRLHVTVTDGRGRVRRDVGLRRWLEDIAPRAARGEVQLFDRGGTVEELRERCLEETELAPPKPPVFNRRVLRFLQEREAKAAEAGAAAE